MPVLKQQQSVHQKLKKYTWADYQNRHLKGEHKELKVLIFAKEKLIQLMSFAVYFERKPTAVRDAAAEFGNTVFWKNKWH